MQNSNLQGPPRKTAVQTLPPLKERTEEAALETLATNLETYLPRQKGGGIISSSTTEEDSLVSLVAVEYLIHVWISTNKSMIHQGKRVPHRVSVTTSCD